MSMATDELSLIQQPIHTLPSKVKGFADLTPKQQVVFSIWKTTVESVYRLHGFNPLDVPPFVNRAFLIAKGGVDAQIFSVNHLRDNSKTKYGIAFDRTVPFSLWLRDHQKEISFPYKRFDINLSYRAETTRTGRLNGFYQADVDVVGRNLPLSCDAQCITTLISALVQLKTPEFVIYINQIEIPKSLISKLGFADPNEALRTIDKLDKTPKEEIVLQLQALNPNIDVNKIQELVELCSFRGSIEEFNTSLLDENEVRYISQIKEVLNYVAMSGIDVGNFKFAPGIVRGLDYYTGIVFETFLKEYPEFGSITSGGRYDELVDTFSEKRTGIQGVGGSIGLSRLFQILLSKDRIAMHAQVAAKVLVVYRTVNLMPQAFEVATQLRNCEIPTDIYSGAAKGVGKQLDYANKTGFPIGVMVLDTHSFVIKDLTTGQQTDDIHDAKVLAKKTVKVMNHRINLNLSIYTYENRSQIDIGHTRTFTIQDFNAVVYGNKKLVLNKDSMVRLEEARSFIEYLLSQNIKVYGITTGFADLRNRAVPPEQASELSRNLILSHDAAIGKLLPKDIVRGAMVIRANSLAKGYSGFQVESLNTLLGMVNAGIIPEIPETGSLGASGDLALLARLGRTMIGDKDSYVDYNGVRMNSKEALEKAGIQPFNPAAKEGLALTNGTSFMSSALSIAYMRQLKAYENILALINVYLSATRSIDAAFTESVQNVRKQKGQSFVAEFILTSLAGSPLIDREDVQNDYSQRCLPAIFGPKFEGLLSLKDQVFNEMDAVTDNPLIFRKEEISGDIVKERRIVFENEEWTVLSGGNFHGEVVATTADALIQYSAKIALTIERHLTFLNNPSRNKGLLPAYLITNEEKAGLCSGFMITQYTGNALTQKICALANPVTNFNLTSANESEDIVSYGNAAVEKLLSQIQYLEELTQVYATEIFQAYAITREKFIDQGGKLDSSLVSERIFAEVVKKVEFPLRDESNFDAIYAHMGDLLKSSVFIQIIGSPLTKKLEV